MSTVVQERARQAPAAGNSDKASPREPVTDTPDVRRQGFLRRYRLPLSLAVVAGCLYVGSIVYIVLVRGQIGT